jgi:NAD(P)H dehydrogenase (quinone)
MDMPERMFLKALRALGLSPFEQAQLRHYMEDYRRDAFAANAPTDAVREVGGSEPEEFEIVVRRYVAAMPEGKRTAGGQARAAWNLARILFTPPIDLDRFERTQGHPSIGRSEYTVDSPVWRAEHVPAGAGPALTAIPIAPHETH